MEFEEMDPRALRSEIAQLRHEFDAAARGSTLLGRDAKNALASIQVEGTRAIGTSKELGRIMSGAFSDVITSGKSLQGVLKSVAADLAKLAAETIFSAGSGKNGFGIGDLLGGLMSRNAKGNVIQEGRVQAFAKGGVLSQPALFPMSGGYGLAGEAGPEAILPLSRGADGKLGVAASGDTKPISITFNVTATDAASFRRSETQIAAMLSRTVSRGARNL